MGKDKNKEPLLYPTERQSSLQSRIFAKKMFSKIILLSVILLVGVSAAGLFFYYKAGNTSEEGDTKTRQAELDALYAREALPIAPEGMDALNYGLEESASTTGEIKGFLVFSGVPQGSSELTKIYTLDLSTTTAKAQRLLPEKFRINAFAEFFDKTTAGDFLVNTLDESISTSSRDKDGTRIQRFNVETGELNEYESLYGFYEQNIAISPSGEFAAYKRLVVPFRSYTDLVPINNWEVVISNIKTDEVVKIIPGANQPKWSADSSTLLVLKADGLHTYQVATGIEMKVIDTGTGDQVLATSMIDVSPDGKYLVWTTAKAGVIVMHEIESWDPFVVKEIGRINEQGSEYYWPQFSPDNKYYVVQAIDAVKEGETDRTNPRFEIRSVLSRTVLRTIPISDFDFNAYFTDTWIAEVPEIAQEDAVESESE